MESDNRILVKKFIGTTIGVGILYFIAKHRKQIVKYVNYALDYRNPLKRQNIHVVDNIEDCAIAANKLKRYCQEYNVLGFDCEWVVSKGKRNPVALLQLATHNGYCALIRLCCFRSLSEELRQILEDENILKVGVCPADDAMYLAYDYGIGVSSTLDLRHLAVLADRSPEGLANMAEKVLNVKLNKHWRIRCSDWEASTLTEQQLKYAASDAHVAVEIFKKFEKDIVPRKFFGNTKDQLREIFDICSPFLDLKFKTSMNSSNIKQSKRTILQKDQKALKDSSRNMCTRTKRLYDNCLLEAPDGELLCTCDKKKADWYVTQNLGKVVSAENPYTVRLNFEPAGRAVGEVGRYYQTFKENQCVVCGRKDVYIRKNVVPRDYRKHFPLVMKTHTSHDVLLLCPKCHQVSNLFDMVLRKKLAKRCNAPIVGTEPGSEKFVEIPHLKQLRSAARALLNKHHNIPPERKKLLEKVILDAYPEEQEVTADLLQEAADVETTMTNEGYNAHGAEVVKYFKESASGLIELEKLWREHFLKTMKPKYLPELWSVTHNAHRLEIRAKEGRIDAEDMAVAGISPKPINDNIDTPVESMGNSSQ